MRLQLLKSLGNYGVLLDWKNFLPDAVDIQVDIEGALTIGNKTYPVVNGKVHLLEYQIISGPNRVSFVDKDGVVYECGCIHKSTRFINIVNPVDKLAVENALATEKLARRVEELEKAVKTIKEQYGITII